MRKSVILSFVVMVSLFFAAITPAVVFAEGEAPEAAPPVVAPVVVTTEVVSAAVQTLAENGAALEDAEGTAVPLASQAALDVLCDPDPWFFGACPGGKCTIYGTINEALTAWKDYHGKGYLYLEGNHSWTEDVIIDGDIYPVFLTMKGIVWDTKTGGEKPHLNGRIEIQNLKSGFTLQGLTINAVSSLPAILVNNTIGTVNISNVSIKNTGGPGMQISNQGAIILNQVTAIENKGTGATLSNIYYTGTKYVPYNVTILNSSFMRNDPEVGSSIALIIESSGNILLNGVTSTANVGSGTEITALGKSLTIKNCVFSKNIASGGLTQGYGIWLEQGSTASITLDNVVLEGNSAGGAILTTTGNITLKKVYAANNGRQGVLISSAYNTPGAGAISVTVQDSSFYWNDKTNLEIYSSGAVKIINLNSTYSQTGSGLWVDNSDTLKPAAVTVLGAVLNDNGFRGGSITSKGTITVSGITAKRATDNGLYLYNAKPGATGNVFMLRTLGINQFDLTSDGYGIGVETNQNTSLASIQAHGNAGYGVVVRGWGANSSVTLVNVETYGSTHPDFAGVRIHTTGNVTLSKVVATGNTGWGISIQNNETPIARTVKISSSTANENGQNGIYVYSIGAITLATINATKNGDSGIYVDNTPTTLTSSITVSGVNVVNNNTGNGMELLSKGKIAVSGATALWNSQVGVEAITSMGVTLTNIQANGNGLWGIHLDTQAATTLSGLTVLHNGYISNLPGVYIKSSSKVLINSGVVMANSGWGLFIDVLNKDTDAKVAPGVIVFGNDAGPAYNEGNVWVE